MTLIRNDIQEKMKNNDTYKDIDIQDITLWRGGMNTLRNRYCPILNCQKLTYSCPTTQ